MEREEFKRALREKDYPYEETLTRIMVGKYRNSIDLSELKSIPSNVVFRNMGSLDLNSIEEIPSGVVFMNGLYVYLNSLRKIDPSVGFFNCIAAVSPLLGSDVSEGGMSPFFSFHFFSIPGIEDIKVLNKMIALGLFNRG
jgi:hypothetical protein